MNKSLNFYQRKLFQLGEKPLIFLGTGIGQIIRIPIAFYGILNLTLSHEPRLSTYAYWLTLVCIVSSVARSLRWGWAAIFFSGKDAHGRYALRVLPGAVAQLMESVIYAVALLCALFVYRGTPGLQPYASWLPFGLLVTVGLELTLLWAGHFHSNRIRILSRGEFHQMMHGTRGPHTRTVTRTPKK